MEKCKVQPITAYDAVETPGDGTQYHHIFFIHKNIVSFFPYFDAQTVSRTYVRHVYDVQMVGAKLTGDTEKDKETILTFRALLGYGEELPNTIASCIRCAYSVLKAVPA